MADLYRTNSPSSSLASEDMSSLLHDILRASANPPPSSSGKHQCPPPPPAVPPAPAANFYRPLPNFPYADPRFGEVASSVREPPLIGSSSGFNFSDSGHEFVSETEAMCAADFDRIGSRKFPLESDVDDFGFDSKDGLEMQEGPPGGAPPRSSKRARAAEVHNLSEKRRRSKINEKLKALQSLIPNSNKTDKASMLDEAIEYLKQLQLQVQMLSMRNGVSLHPFSLPGSINRTEFSSLGIGFEEQNELLNAKGDDGLSGSRDTFLHGAFSLPNQYAPSNPANATCSISNIANAETLFGLGPSNQSHNVMSFSHLTSPKDICTGNRLAQMQMDMSCLGENPSSGVSS